MLHPFSYINGWVDPLKGKSCQWINLFQDQMSDLKQEFDVLSADSMIEAQLTFLAF